MKELPASLVAGFTVDRGESILEIWKDTAIKKNMKAPKPLVEVSCKI
jgi:hypothetical protein